MGKGWNEWGANGLAWWGRGKEAAGGVTGTGVSVSEVVWVVAVGVMGEESGVRGAVLFFGRLLARRMRRAASWRRARRSSLGVVARS